MPTSGPQAAAGGSSSDSDADDPAWPIADSEGSVAATQDQTAPETLLQQWAGVCIVPLQLDHVSMLMSGSIDAQLGSANGRPEAPCGQADAAQINECSAAHEGPMTRAKCAKRQSERPLYSPRSSPTQAKNGTLDSHIAAAQQEATEQLLQNGHGHRVNVPETSAATARPGAAAAVAPLADTNGSDDVDLDQCVDWDVIEAWLSTPDGGVALEWEGLDAPALDRLLKVRPVLCLQGVQTSCCCQW